MRFILNINLKLRMFHRIGHLQVFIFDWILSVFYYILTTALRYCLIFILLISSKIKTLIIFICWPILPSKLIRKFQMSRTKKIMHALGTVVILTFAYIEYNIIDREPRGFLYDHRPLVETWLIADGKHLPLFLNSGCGTPHV